MTKDVATDLAVNQGASKDVLEENVSTEEEFLKNYDPSSFPPVGVTVDIVCFTILAGKLSVLLVQRKEHPYKDAWAIPGGFVCNDESLQEAALRELQEETGLTSCHLEQLGSFGEPERDPRMRVVSTSYMAFLPDLPEPKAGSDASCARFFALEDLGLEDSDGLQLAFDHKEILRAALLRARSKLEYTPLATSFVSESFTLPELRRVYEAVWGCSLQPANFRRKVLSTPNFVIPEETPATTVKANGRPPVFYKKGKAKLLHPALLSPYTKELASIENLEESETVLEGLSS